MRRPISYRRVPKQRCPTGQAAAERAHGGEGRQSAGYQDVNGDRAAAPSHWAFLGAMDFGWDHPFAAVKLAWDRDADCVYVVNIYRVREQTPVVQPFIRPRQEARSFAASDRNRAAELLDQSQTRFPADRGEPPVVRTRAARQLARLTTAELCNVVPELEVLRRSSRGILGEPQFTR